MICGRRGIQIVEQPSICRGPSPASGNRAQHANAVPDMRTWCPTCGNMAAISAEMPNGTLAKAACTYPEPPWRHPPTATRLPE